MTLSRSSELKRSLEKPEVGFSEIQGILTVTLFLTYFSLWWEDLGGHASLTITLENASAQFLNTPCTLVGENCSATLSIFVQIFLFMAAG